MRSLSAELFNRESLLLAKYCLEIVHTIYPSRQRSTVTNVLRLFDQISTSGRECVDSVWCGR